MGKREKNIIAKRLVHSYLSSIISIALVLLLVWIYYAAMIFFSGALITAVIDERWDARVARRESAAVEDPRQLPVLLPGDGGPSTVPATPDPRP